MKWNEKRGEMSQHILPLSVAWFNTRASGNREMPVSSLKICNIFKLNKYHHQLLWNCFPAYYQFMTFAVSLPPPHTHTSGSWWCVMCVRDECCGDMGSNAFKVAGLYGKFAGPWWLPSPWHQRKEQYQLLASIHFMCLLSDIILICWNQHTTIWFSGFSAHWAQRQCRSHADLFFMVL